MLGLDCQSSVDEVNCARRMVGVLGPGSVSAGQCVCITPLVGEPSWYVQLYLLVCLGQAGVLNAGCVDTTLGLNLVWLGTASLMLGVWLVH